MLYLDWETLGLAYEAEKLGVAVLLDQGEPFWVPLHDPESFKLRIEGIVGGNPGPIVMHNASFDIPHFEQLGIYLPPKRVHDTMLISYLLHPSRKVGHSLREWGEELGAPKDEFDFKAFLADPRTRLQKSSDPDLVKYALQDVVTTRALYEHLIPLMTAECEVNPKFRELYLSEMKYMQFLIACKWLGYQLDLGKLPGVTKDIEERMRVAEKHLKKLAPYHTIHTEKLYKRFAVKLMEYIPGVVQKERVYSHCPVPWVNYNSTAQKLNILKNVGWVPTKKTEKGQDGCDADSLKPYVHETTPRGELCKAVLTNQALTKLHGTYLMNFRTFEEGGMATSEGVLRGNFNQCLTKTGRLSSSEPNLQNLSRRGEYGHLVRGLFIAVPGRVFASVDLDQIEFRVVSHFLLRDMGCSRLIKPFLDGEDVHTYNAIKWGVSRDDAKTIVYSILFGGGPMVCGSGDYKRGKEMLDLFHKSNPRFDQWKQKVLADIRRNGCILRNDFGRRFVLPELNSKDKILRGTAERNAISCKVQGTAGDIFKYLTVQAFDSWDEQGFLYHGPVHDEITFSLLPQTAVIDVEVIRRDLSSPAGGLLLCPIASQGKIGESWLQCH